MKTLKPHFSYFCGICLSIKTEPQGNTKYNGFKNVFVGISRGAGEKSKSEFGVTQLSTGGERIIEVVVNCGTATTGAGATSMTEMSAEILARRKSKLECSVKMAANC